MKTKCTILMSIKVMKSNTRRVCLLNNSLSNFQCRLLHCTETKHYQQHITASDILLKKNLYSAHIKAYDLITLQFCTKFFFLLFFFFLLSWCCCSCYFCWLQNCYKHKSIAHKHRSIAKHMNAKNEQKNTVRLFFYK